MTKDKMSGKQAVRVAVLGVVVAVFYWLLFHNEMRVLTASTQGGWSFLVPVSIAFVFSFAHGAFTGEFWDLLGVKAKKK